VLAQEPLAQSSAAVVLECTPFGTQSGHQTVIGGFAYQVRTGRISAHPSGPFIAGQRKPPASTWTANAAWQREASA